MSAAVKMPPAYVDLARQRVETRWPPYKQPEDFGYDFRTWVSPYTKGANSFEGVAVVLQDWASDDGLARWREAGIERLGRVVNLLTNRRLELLLRSVFGLRLEDVYATNVFPFVKPGSMSSGIPQKHMDLAATRFTVRELEIAKPQITLALGRTTHCALQRAGVQCYELPHPAARIGGVEKHARCWRQALGGIL